MKRRPTERQLKEIDKLAKGNLYSSMLPPDAKLADRLKFELCAQIIRYKREKGLNQKGLGVLLKANEARVSEIVHYKIDKFTADKLIQFLERLNPRASVRVG